MDEQLITQLTASTQQLAAAAEALEIAISRFDAQHQELNAKVERIVAAIEESRVGDPCPTDTTALQTRVAELERANLSELWPWAQQHWHLASVPKTKSIMV